MDGFQVPIHNSLTQPILMGGAPREFALLNGTITAACLLGLQTFLALPLGIVLHVVAERISRKDEQFLLTFMRHLHQQDYYRA